MALLLFFLTFLAFFLLGDKVCKTWGLRFSEPGEALVFCTALGLVAVSYLTAVLAFTGWITPLSAWILLALIYVSRARKSIEVLRHLGRWLRPSSFLGRVRRLGRFDQFSLAVLILLVFLTLTLAQTPPTRTDALVYHLAVPKVFLENHGVVNLPDNIYSFFPQQFEMLYLFCLALGGEVLARLAGLGMTILLLWALSLFFRQTFSARYAVFVPVVYFSTPTFFDVAAAGYVDIAAAGFVFLTYFAWDLWRRRGDRGWLFLMVTFAGSAVATKLTCVIVLPLVFLGILVTAGKRYEPRLLFRTISIFVLAVGVLLLPWWARNAYYTGNPFAPYFMQFFKNSGGINWDADRSALQSIYYHSFGMGRRLLDFLLLPVNLTFFSATHSLRFDGVIGILYLLLVPAWVWLREKALPLISVFAVWMIFWFLHFQYVRLLAPAFTFLAVLSVAGLERMTRPHPPGKPPATAPAGKKMVTRIVPVVLALGLLFNLNGIVRDWTRQRPLPYLLGQESRDQYLERHIPSYPLYRAVNDLDRDAVVLMVFMRNLGYLSNRKFISDTFFEAYTLQNLLKKDPTIQGLSRQLRSMGVTHLLFNFDYVFGKNSAFSPEERTALMEFINAKGRLVKKENEFYLYHLVVK